MPTTNRYYYTELCSDKIKFTSNYGPRTYYDHRYKRNVTNFHNGIDFGGTFTTLSTVKGRVVYAGYDGSGFGNLVIILSDTSKYHWYGHLSRIYLKYGQNVTKGTQVGVTGKTGNSTGEHLHYSISTGRSYKTRIDPTPYITFSNTPLTAISKSYLSNMIFYEDKRYIKTTNTTPMNFRKEPSTKAEANPVKVPGGTELRIYGETKGENVKGNDNWYAVKYEGHDGFISGAYLTPIASKDEITPTIEALKGNIEQLKQENENLVEVAARTQAQIEDAVRAKEEALRVVNELHQDEIEALQLEIEGIKKEYDEKAEILEKYDPQWTKSEVIGVITTGLKEEVKARGAEQKLLSLRDKIFKSDFVRSFTRYDWLYILGSGLTYLSGITADVDLNNTELFGVSIASGAIIKYLIRRALDIVIKYGDRNKDGKLDKDDTVTLK